MADIQIKTYVPSEGRGDLNITVDGEEYSVTWDDGESEPEIMGVPLDDEIYPEVKERLELFFTFFDHGALRVYTKSLTQDAVYEMQQHLDRNAAAGSAPLTTADKITKIEQSGLTLAWDTCHKIYLCENGAAESDALGHGYVLRPAAEIRTVILGSCGLVFVSRWPVSPDGNFDHAWAIDQCTEDIFDAAEGKA